MLRRGELDGKIPDLGGKAMLHPRTAEAFRERGYKCVYLDVGKDELVKHVLRDYARWRSGENITRSNINVPILEAEEVAKTKWLSEHPDAKDERSEDCRRSVDVALHAQASLTVADLLRQREQKYRNAATAVVAMSGDLEKDVAQIMTVVRSDDPERVSR